MIKDLIEAIVEGKDYKDAFDKTFNTIISEKLKQLRSSVYENLLEGKYAGEGSSELIPATIKGKVKLVKRKLKVSENLEIDEEETLDEGIVVGPSSKVFHKKTGNAKYTLHLTDVAGKEHKIYSVEDKEGSEPSAKKAATSMAKSLAKKYGVKSWHESEEYDENLESILDSLLKE